VHLKRYLVLFFIKLNDGHNMWGFRYE
jgi:hypothetical protein